MLTFEESNPSLERRENQKRIQSNCVTQNIKFVGRQQTGASNSQQRGKSQKEIQ
jgi:hypothetical protein